MNNENKEESLKGKLVATVEEMKEYEFDESIDIYERLEPGDILILTREGDDFIVAENDDGHANIKRVKITEK